MSLIKKSSYFEEDIITHMEGNISSPFFSLLKDLSCNGKPQNGNAVQFMGIIKANVLNIDSFLKESLFSFHFFPSSFSTRSERDNVLLISNYSRNKIVQNRFRIFC